MAGNDALRHYLHDSGETYAQFGNRVGGYHKRTVGKWVRGERIPRKATLKKIHLATGGRVPPSSFYHIENLAISTPPGPVKKAGGR